MRFNRKQELIGNTVEANISRSTIYGLIDQYEYNAVQISIAKHEIHCFPHM